jgi:hypothetical protein
MRDAATACRTQGSSHRSIASSPGPNLDENVTPAPRSNSLVAWPPFDLGPALAAVVSVLTGLLIVLCAAWPGLGFPLAYIDEGYNLSLAKHLAETGQYATHVLGMPLRWFDPAVTTGPPVLVPMAMVIKLFGVGITPVRVVSLIFLILFLIGAFLAAREQSGENGSLAGVAVLVLLGTLSYDLYDRGLRVLGEVPALAFFFIGVAAANRSTRAAWLVGGAGLALSLATKPQMAIAVIATSIVVLALSWHDRRLLIERLVPFLAGWLLPYGLWHIYQIEVVGLEEWWRINIGFYDLFASSSGARLLLKETELLSRLVPAAAAVVLVLATVTWQLRRDPTTKQTVFRALGLLTVFALVLVPLLFMRWNWVTERFGAQLHDHPMETAVALGGLLLAFVIGVFHRQPVLLMTSASGLLFAEWYFGINAVGWDRHGVYWRYIGLVLAGVALSFIVAVCRIKVSRLMNRLFENRIIRSVGPYWSSGLAILAMTLVLLHSLPFIQAEQTRQYQPMADAAAWVLANTPEDAILLGSGWWMPWEASYLTGRDLADVEASGFEPRELNRPTYLVIPPDLLGHFALSPIVEEVM